MDDWLKIAALLLSTVTALALWRVQLIGKRKFEVAEESLMAFAQCKDAISHVRGALSYEGEGRTRPRGEGESREETERLDRRYVPFERLQRVSESFVGLRKSQLLCLYHFGKEAHDTLDVLFQARADIIFAATTLAESDAPRHRYRESTPEEEKMDRDAHADLYATGGKYDVMAKKIAAAERTLEAICGPYLTYRSAFWPQALNRRWNSASSRNEYADTSAVIPN